MAASPLADAMNRLQRDVGAPLKQAGFKVRGRTYNRATADGLTIRERLGALDGDGRDVWWRIRPDAETTSELRARLSVDGLPFLDRFASRDAILREWATATDNMGVSSPPRIVKAIILAARGQSEDARRLLQQQAGETRNPGHPAYVRELAVKLGLPPL